MKGNTLTESAPGGNEERSTALFEHICRGMKYLWRKVLKLGQRQPRSLRLCESLSLGDRRFVVVVEYGASRFLLGGTSGSLVLLANLNGSVAAEVENEKSCAGEAGAKQ